MYTIAPSSSKFESMVTEMFDRVTDGGGFLKGDVVKLKSSVRSSDWFKQQASSVQEKLEKMIEKSNRVYRISVLKSEQPRAAGSFGMGAPVAKMADVVQEINPSFWINPVTVPLQYLENIDTGVNMPAYDKDLVRKDTSHIKPTDKIKNTDDYSAKQTDVNDRKLPSTNTTIKYGTKWDDKYPGGRKDLKSLHRVDRRKKLL